VRGAPDLQLRAHRRRVVRRARGLGEKILRYLDHLDSYVQEYDRLISLNQIYVKRLANVAVISRDKAIAYGLCGPNLRGSGISWDARRDLAYGAYPEFQFDVPVGSGKDGSGWGLLDRYAVRVLEMLESSKIVRQALAKLPEGEIMAKVLRKPKPSRARPWDGWSRHAVPCATT